MNNITLTGKKPTVKLVGTDGNAFAVIGRVLGVLRKEGYSEEQRKKFLNEATLRQRAGNGDEVV